MIDLPPRLADDRSHAADSHYRLLGNCSYTHTILPWGPNVLRRLSKSDKAKISQLIESAFDRLLTFKTAYNLQRHFRPSDIHKISDLEVQMHNDYPVKGTGIKLDPTVFSAKDRELDRYIHSEETIAPEVITNHLDDYPLEAASAAYVFAILESVGNEVIGIINPSYVSPRKAWHTKVYGDTDTADRSKVIGARDGFAIAFPTSRKKISTRAAKRLIWLKSHRNAFAHDGATNVNFELYLQYTLVTLYQIAHIAIPKWKDLKRFPYEDHEGKFV